MPRRFAAALAAALALSGCDWMLDRQVERNLTRANAGVLSSPDLTTPREAAEIARDAGVKHLVLSHLVPAPTNALAECLFLDGADEVFEGEITLGEDGMRFTLAPGPE